VADRAVGLRDVLVLAGACVVAVLGAAVVTSFLPADAQSVVFRTPLLIVVLIVGTAAALWRIARPRAESAPPEETGAEPRDRPTGG
jgi:FtsH-binding integral membrane protein